MTVGILVFPGTNCEFDVAEAYAEIGVATRLIGHGEPDLGELEAVVLPGGFAYGDYLRPGAIARFAPVMRSLVAFAEAGGPVLGICNGFQVLTEAHLLPGALQKNAGLSFICATAPVEVVGTRNVLTREFAPGDRFDLPINHFEGNFTADGETLKRLEGEGRIVLRYTDNPNGSALDIAGIANERGNVVGLMPHPERAGMGYGLTVPARMLLESLVA